MNFMDTLLQLMEVYGYAAMFVAMVAEYSHSQRSRPRFCGISHFTTYFRFLDDLYHRLRSRRDRLNSELLARFVWRPSSALEIRQIYLLQ